MIKKETNGLYQIYRFYDEAVENLMTGEIK